MNLLINITLLGLGFFGTLAAFGGETWKKGDEPLRRRITRRGWISVVCLSLTLLLGTTKEVKNTGEKSVLEAQVRGLQEQLRRHGNLLASKRLEEINDQEQRLVGLEQRLSAVQSVYESFRSSASSIHGREQRRNSPPPFAINFSHASSNFRFDVCGSTFKAAAGRSFDEVACATSSLPELLETLPNTSFEHGEFGPSVIALMQRLAEISIAHRDALNGPRTVEKRDTPEISLGTLLSDTLVVCGADQKLVASQEIRARVLRTIEESAQQLYWLFVYGYPSGKNDKNSAWLNEQFSGASSELLVQMSILDEISRVHNDKDSETPYKLGRFIENIEISDRRLTAGTQQILASCKARREQLAAERKEIKGRK